MGTKRCAACGGPVSPGQRFCTACGSRLGVPGVPQARREPIVEEEELSRPLRALIWFLELFPGFVSAVVIVMSILATAAGVGIVLMGLFVLAMGAAIAGFMIAGFGLLCYWSAVVWMMSGYLCLPQDGLAEFDGAKWTVFGVLAMLPIALVYGLMGVGAVEV